MRKDGIIGQIPREIPMRLGKAAMNDRFDPTWVRRMILLIDNYDSFTFNIVQRFGEIDPALEVQVVRNDQISLDEIRRMAPEKIVISPGPCTPREAGISCDVIREFGPKVPILGVCLGHQCMGEALGGLVVRAPRIMHGKTSMIHHDGKGVYRGLSNPFVATRYHSLVIDPGHVPADLEVVSKTAEGEIMGVRHRVWPMEGVQFHPESFLTMEGIRLLANFVERPLHGSCQTIESPLAAGATPTC
jgi:anthranilate synthase/aminodeoxychorismate synthase-like glutamine amidotransferase